MATLTRLASTLTAKYFPSQTITDAFYIDGRLFGKRETRQADITIDKEERGFFFSVFAHPRIPEYEPGMMPPYEPQLRGTCNEVKFGRKEIDGMIEGFLSTAVDVTGKMKLGDGNDRSPYFAGVIVRDAEAFAVTIGNGLAFLYRDDTLFPLTDAGIPMEPIDSDGNRVGDFLYYCSSKTANALWSNFFTLSPDDCIILCNKEVYDALGQREMLRILADAEDQCDAAGVIITQASARMPNVPMQFSISFVESVTSDEKKGLFGFRKKNKEEDTSDMSIKSTTDGGVVGAAAEAAADAGFTGGLALTDSQEYGSTVMFGDNSPSPAAPAVNQVASAEQGIVVGDGAPAPAGIEFLDTSVESKPVVEVSAEEMMKTLFGESTSSAASASTDAAAAGTAAAATVATAGAAAAASSPFVADPSAPASGEAVEMKEILSAPFNIPEDDDNSKTKPVIKLDHSLLDSLKTPESGNSGADIRTDGIIEAALRELDVNSEDKAKMEDKNETFEKDGQIVFAPGSESVNPNTDAASASAKDEFNPYSVGAGEEMKNAAPLVFGDDGFADAINVPSTEEQTSGSIPVPEFGIDAGKKEPDESEKLAVDFPSDEIKAAEATAAAAAATATAAAEGAADESSFVLPFEQSVSSFADEPKGQPVEEIPDMPLYNGNTFDSPVAAASSEEPINAESNDVYSYGQYIENENMAQPEPQAPYQPYGGEGMNYGTDAAADSGFDAFDGAAAAAAGYAAAEGFDPNAAPYADQGYAQPQAAASSEDSWIDSILGLDENGGYQDYSQSQAQDQGSYSSFDTAAPAQRPGAAQRPSAAQRPRTSASGSGNGRGGNGGKRKIKLNRNGYMFLAFVGICIICLIILIAVIVKSCGKKDASDKSAKQSANVSESVGESESAATTPAPTQPAENDPLAPIGIFQFSDNTGFRTWWDLMKTIYNIEITSEDADEVKRVIDYNLKMYPDMGYTSDDMLGYGNTIYLPPVGVVNGTLSLDGAAPATDGQAQSQSTTSGEPQVIDQGTGDDGVARDHTGADTDAGVAEGAPVEGGGVAGATELVQQDNGEFVAVPAT